MSRRRQNSRPALHGVMGFFLNFQIHTTRSHLFLFYFLLIFFARAVVVFPQSVVKIYGQVLDDQSGLPLANSNVELLNSAYGAVTDEAGQFMLENLFNGEYELRASYMGFKSLLKKVNVTSDQPAFIIFRLKPQVLLLEQVNITAKRDGGESVDNVLVFTQQDIRRTPTLSLGDFIQRFANVDVNRTGAAGSRQTVSIRGANANQVLVLLDDVRLNDGLSGEVDLSQIPLNMIERIEIRPGNEASLYGSGAFGGVIALYTTKGGENRFRLTSQNGSFGFWSIEPSWSGRKKGWEASIAANKLSARNDYSFQFQQDDKVKTTDQRLNADFSSYNLFLHLGLVKGNHHLSCKAHRYTSVRGQPGSVFALTPYARAQATRSKATASYQFESNMWSVRGQLHVSQDQSDNENLLPLQPVYDFGSVPQFAFHNQLSTTVFQLETEMKPWSGFEQKMGVEGRLVRFNSYNLLQYVAQPIDDASEQTTAFFIRQRINHHLNSIFFSLLPAVRFDHALFSSAERKRWENHWSPSLHVYASWGGESIVYFKVDVAKGFRYPTFADLYYQDFRVQGQADLLPEESQSAEWAIGGQLKMHGRWNAEVKQFENRFRNMIVWRLGSFEFFRPYNTDAELRGTEIVLSYTTPASFLSLEANVSFLRPLNKNPNQTLYNKFLPYRPLNALKGRVTLQHQNWSSILDVRCIGSRFLNEANTKELPPYRVFDATLSKMVFINKRRLSVNASMLNISNEQFEM
ncbi:MAG: TonB-dependent receptor, partial [Calditrichaeota bacterium]